jgi:YHS domain-containing protein
MRLFITLATLLAFANCTAPVKKDGKSPIISDQEIGYQQTQHTDEEQASLSVSHCITEDTIGVGGHDLITYFEEENPRKGITKFVAKHEGIYYLFANEVNYDKFRKNPERFLPQYGGWCAINIAKGLRTTPRYDLYHIQNGKLYLFERTLSVNGKELWLTDYNNNKINADNNYGFLVKNGVFPNEE